MKCQNCEAEIPDGEYFCPFCGAEVQLVQDYRNQVDYMLREKELKEQEAKKQREEEERLKREAAERLKPKPWVVAVRSLLILAGGAALGGWIVTTISANNAKNLTWQRTAAVGAYDKKEYDQSRRYIDAALALEPDSLDTQILDARLLFAEGKTEDAIARLQALLETAPNERELYRLLVSIYESKEDIGSIVELVKEMPSGIQESYSQYLVSEPVLSLPSGSYDFGTRLEIRAEDDAVIYYTINGTMPSRKSQQYQNAIILPLGTTTVRAAAVNALGAMSEISERTYKVNRVVPDLTKSGSASEQSR